MGMYRVMTALLAGALVFGASATARAEPQPQMHAALRLLREAKTHPAVAKLHKAKEHLQKADHDKGGHRKRAIELIEHAIRAQQKGDQRQASARVGHAIQEIEKGMAFDDTHGGRRR
jgi:hypothetical protein